MRKSIVIGVPTLGTVSMNWAMAFSQLAAPMNAAVGRIVEQGFEVGVARNKIVAKALACETAPTHVFFLDDDVLPRPGCLLQLLSHGLDIVAGVYFTKGEVSEPLILLPPGRGVMPYIPDIGVRRVWGVGMGLTLIHTDVFRSMADSLPKDIMGNPRWFHTSGDGPDEERVTEDLWFCRLAQEAGHEIWCDTSPHAFGWHFCKAQQVGYPLPQWREFQRSGTATFHVPKTKEPQSPWPQ